MRPSGARGFTLIELAFAIVLLAVGLLALVGALGRALDESRRARLRHLVLRQMEGVADSLALVDGARAGAVVRPDVLIEWNPEPCVAGACLRVRAITVPDSDTLTILVAGRSVPR